MLSYCIRRILHMIPILSGVILLTFILFNVVGGSPAAFVLGKNASAQALDEFDAQFGYNKPLFFGKKLKTRLISDVFEQKNDEKTLKTSENDTKLPSEQLLKLNYPPKPGKTYVLRLEGTFSPAECTQADAASSNEPYLVLHCFYGKNGEKTEKMPLKKAFSTLETRFSIPKSPEKPENVSFGLVLDPKCGFLPEKCEIYEVSEHFFSSQFLDYLSRLIRLDMGVSTATNRRVADILRQGVLPSIALNLPILLGGLVVSVVLALLCAWHRGRFFDRFAVFAATGLMSVNYIVWIVAGQYFFAYRLGWFPIWGFESWRYLLLPVAIGIVSGLGKDVRFYRTVMLEEVYRDYVRTARAKGLSDGTILFKHVLRNALVPIITNVSLTLPFLFTGSLLLETFFGIPGLGGISVNAINSSDMAVVQAVVLIGALLYVIINLLTDICYAWVDPRIRLK